MNIDDLNVMLMVRNILTDTTDDQWVTGTRRDYYGRHCALGHVTRATNSLDDFDPLIKKIIDITRYRDGSYESELVAANNNTHPTYKHIPSIRGRALACVDDYIAKLSGCEMASK